MDKRRIRMMNDSDNALYWDKLSIILNPIKQLGSCDNYGLHVPKEFHPEAYPKPGEEVREQLRKSKAMKAGMRS